jgi:arylsulfatase A-like enzyme
MRALLSTTCLLGLVVVARADPKPRVVSVSVDGLRADAITNDVMPRHVKLAKAGAVASRASTISRSDTLPSHASMLSGVDVTAHKIDWNSMRPDRGFIKAPTIFALAGAQGLSTAMIVGKQKLRHLAPPDTVDHFDVPSDPTCAGVASAAAKHVAGGGSDLLFVHFSDPDDAGHDHGWASAEYARAAATADTCLGVVIEAIDKSPAAAKTTVIVTADHGGSGHKHSDGAKAANRTIPWIIRGPGIKPGTRVRANISTMDTAATALAILGVEPPAAMAGVSRLP